MNEGKGHAICNCVTRFHIIQINEIFSQLNLNKRLLLNIPMNE